MAATAAQVEMVAQAVPVAQAAKHPPHHLPVAQAEPVATAAAAQRVDPPVTH